MGNVFSTTCLAVSHKNLTSSNEIMFSRNETGPVKYSSANKSLNIFLKKLCKGIKFNEFITEKSLLKLKLKFS